MTLSHDQHMTLSRAHHMQGSQHYEFPSTESEHYWCPANNEADLYRQLSQHKYQEIPRSSVIQDEQIGEGEFGVVCQGEWQNVSGVVQQVAIKMLHSEDNKVKFLQEAAAMGQFNHPHVARLFGVVTVGKPVSGTASCTSCSVMSHDITSCPTVIAVHLYFLYELHHMTSLLGA